MRISSLFFAAIAVMLLCLPSCVWRGPMKPLDALVPSQFTKAISGEYLVVDQGHSQLWATASETRFPEASTLNFALCIQNTSTNSMYVSLEQSVFGVIVTQVNSTREVYRESDVPFPIVTVCSQGCMPFEDMNRVDLRIKEDYAKGRSPEFPNQVLVEPGAYVVLPTGGIGPIR